MPFTSDGFKDTPDKIRASDSPAAKDVSSCDTMVFGKACNIAENLIDFDETQRKQTPDTQNDNVRTIAVHSVPLQHAGTLASTA